MSAESARTMSDYSLCEKVIYGTESQRKIAFDEMAKRRRTCDQYVNLIVSKRQAEDANAAAFLGALAGAAAVSNSAKPYYAPPAPATNNYYVAPSLPRVNITPPTTTPTQR